MHRSNCKIPIITLHICSTFVLKCIQHVAVANLKLTSRTVPCSFLTKLLTIDLPNLYVLPRRINFDIIPQEHSFASHIVEAVRIGPGSTASPPKIATTEGFKGELTVTLCEAQNLPIGGLIGWSNPYCTLAIGEQWVESKKNSETSHPSGHKNPVWNQVSGQIDKH